jgi:hypothetical protein
MSVRVARVAVVGLFATVLALVVVHVALVVANWDTPTRDPVDRIALPPTLMAFALAAGIVIWQRPGNTIGWLLGVTAIALAAYASSDEYALRAVVGSPDTLPAATFAAWLQGWIWTPMLGLFMPGLALFPDGKPLSPAWRPLTWFSIVAVLLFAVGSATNSGPLLEERYVENPVGLPIGALEAPLYVLLISLLFANTVALLLRYRRSTPTARQQIKWLALSGIGLACVFPLQIFLEPYDGPRMMIGIAFFTVLLGIPLSLAIAILRHGLYDIDLLINRTLVYGALTIATVSSYIALVLGLGWMARLATGEGSNELAVAVTTLVVAALFQPVRRRIQSIVDRRFYRARYDAARALDDFQQRLRHQTDLESLRREITQVARETVQPAHVAVWLRHERSER